MPVNNAIEKLQTQSKFFLIPLNFRLKEVISRWEKRRYMALWRTIKN